LLALGIFWRVCRGAFSPQIAGLAVGILAVSYYPVRHACEVKPYAFDLCFSVVYLWIALAYLRDAKIHWLVALVAVTPIAVFTSYPSVFVAGSVSLVLLPAVRSAGRAQRGLYALFNLILLTSFIIHYGVVGQHGGDPAEAERTREFLRNYWMDAFPPGNLIEWPIWLLKIFTGNMLAYPIGAQHGGSSLTFLFVLLGSFALWRNGNSSLLALCWLPFGLNLVAAFLHKYPFGDSARITLHLAPAICILMAHGIMQALDWIPSFTWRTRLHFAVYVILLACGIVGIARDVAKPFKTEHDRDVRQLARDIARDVDKSKHDAALVVLAHDRERELLAEFLWNLHAHGLQYRWQSQGIDPGARSYWLVQCGHTEPMSAPLPGWHLGCIEVRLVPPENAKMQAVYCRWSHMVRD
jgi:hypothetical protein